MIIVRALLSIAVKKGWDLFQLDVNTFYMVSYIEVYMNVAQDLAVEKRGLVCKLRKFLYGLNKPVDNGMQVN